MKNKGNKSRTFEPGDVVLLWIQGQSNGTELITGNCIFKETAPYIVLKLISLVLYLSRPPLHISINKTSSSNKGKVRMPVSDILDTVHSKNSGCYRQNNDGYIWPISHKTLRLFYWSTHIWELRARQIVAAPRTAYVCL